ncbi:TonB-dependent receptor domain-containing protein [Sphingomonas citricola]|uniref:TonB-dependent receptor domain-containing protein n=1 Tax=Sphingomonas citricola TaxID=2862498 RepID=UPI0021560D0F|nr:TonB-dependent receptor [Sphingomonas citricola]
MNKTMLRAAFAAATALAGGAMLAPASVSAQVGQASLRGTITAPADNPVVEVTAVEVATGIRRSVPAGPDGSYNFASLRAGTYRLEIRQKTGVRNSDTFTLRVGQTAGLDLDLSTAPAAPATTTEPKAGGATGTEPAGTPSTGAETAGDGDIIVTGSRIRSLSGGQVGINITPRLIEQLPQNNRNFLAFADLAPGVRFLEDSSGNSRIQGGAQDSRTVNVFIDGVSQKDYVLKSGITGQDSSQGNPFPQLAIGEYQVLSSNYKAEFDQVSSVAITAITKSGTNEFHGEGFFDYTDQSLRDRRPSEIFPTTIDKVQTTQKQFGGALGGPIIKDKMHFFASYEGKRLDNPYDVRPNNGLSTTLLPSQYQNNFGTFSNSFKEDLYFGKIDIVPTDADLIELSGKYRDESGLQNGTGTLAPSGATLNKVQDKRGLLRWQHTADKWINDARVSYEDASWSPQPAVNGNATLFQATQRSVAADGSVSTVRTDLLQFGAGTNFQNKGQKGWTVQDDFTWTGFEGHTIKVGFKTKFVKLRSLQQNLTNPLFTYDVNAFSQTGFNDTQPYRLQFGAVGASGDALIQSNNFQLGLYAQDDWDVTDRLTLNLGLRWDYERTPSYLDYVTPAEIVNAVSATNYPNLAGANYSINDYISTGRERKAFTGAFQPRIGFTYRFDEAGRFSMFGGYGRSYDRNQFDFLQQELSQGAFQTRTFNFIGNDSLNPCDAGANPTTCIQWNPAYLTAEGRQSLLNTAVGGGRELIFMNNDLKVPYSDQFSLGLRGRFAALELEIGYTHIKSRDGFAFLLGNRRPDGSFFFNDPASATDVPQNPWSFTPNGYGNLILGTNGLKTNSDAAYFKLTKPYTAASPWSIDATYTYTQAEENRQFGEVYSLDYESLDDYPTLRSSGVPRHRFVTAGSVDLPIGVTLSGKFQIESPAYQKAFLDQSQPFQRVIIGSTTLGNGDLWGRRQLDLAVTKYIPFGFVNDQARVRLRLDVINVMNDRNYVDFDNNPNSATFRQQVGYSVGGNPPRTVKLSAGFSF